ncbi:flagellar motor switch protein FliG [Sulfurivirga caldicuralii]|uniref:Flagellar motor switch protein FliG n=1 Tax=Sulfurivirga caldicuralii TaxID=364032 RepID=A0A1N6GS44_9GAMM|nr:FliG C-terminal domain-containing protein [Sulfurivirga caldicuralii]SIO10346.1 flagellar motor switch protein FliG [Sulfurivirga caldicuralii]
MDIEVRRLKNGEIQLDFGRVMLNLQPAVIKALQQALDARLNACGEKERAAIKKKLAVFSDLAKKLAAVDDRIMQRMLSQLTAEQLVTLARLGGEAVLRKIERNLSKTNRRQFEEDYARLNRITEHQAVIYMEQIVPVLKKIAQEQKALEAQMAKE